jgi:uracil-DNA glycosylase
MKFTHDADDTARRRTALERYVREALLTAEGGFICKSCDAVCRRSAAAKDLAFIEGEMPHMGGYFSLVDDKGAPTRVVIVGQERGRGKPIVQMEERTAVVQSKRDPWERNPHLRGTTNALLLMMGLSPGGRDGESTLVDGTTRHVLDCFVLTNSTLCSALLKHRTTGLPTTAGRPTPEMKKRCVEHLRAMLRIWEPTILLLQGDSARMTASDALGTSLVRDSAIDMRINDTSCRVCPVTHPNSHSSSKPDILGWVYPTSHYFRETLTPMLR